jgi:hypothetical protein
MEESHNTIHINVEDLKKEIKNFKKGEYLHPEDVASNIKLIEAMDLVIKYYGG